MAIGDTVSEIDKQIWVIFQDNKNNYWFGSNGQGVYHYDGKAIRHFTTEDGLSNDSIREIQADKSGHIFFTTQHGISKFDGQKFTTLPVEKTNASGSEWKSEPDDLWFKGNYIENDVYRYDGQRLYQLQFPKHYLEAEFYKNFPKSPFSPYGVYAIYKDSKGNIWFGTACLGICRYDGKSLSWMYEKELTETPNGGSFGIRSILEDTAGKFWFCNTHFHYKISPNDSVSNGTNFIKYAKGEGIGNAKDYGGDELIYFLSIVEDNHNELWMVTYNQGVFRYDGKKITHYPVKAGNTTITLFSIYKDRQGVLWLGTHEAGAYKFNGQTFEPFRP